MKMAKAAEHAIKSGHGRYAKIKNYSFINLKNGNAKDDSKIIFYTLYTYDRYQVSSIIHS